MKKLNKVLFLSFFLINVLTQKAFSNKIKPEKEITEIKTEKSIKTLEKNTTEEELKNLKSTIINGNYSNGINQLVKFIPITENHTAHTLTIDNLFNFIIKSEPKQEYFDLYKNELEKVVIKNPLSAYYEILFEIYKFNKDYESLLNIIRSKILFSNNNITNIEKSVLFEKMGDVYSEMNNFPSNIDNYQRAIQIHPNNKTAREKLAFNFLLIGEFDEAENNYKKLLEINVDNEKSRLGLAIIFYLKGDSKKSEEYLNMIKNKDKEVLLMELFTRVELSKGKLSGFLRGLGL